ncbi:hypothetical protein HHK36_017082 [Tetracentron sinense]|uniref:Uncharacterized protein n=1 Tax=Tetracentron sinense TaxID=13715 RepID=A0A834Z3X2_TETSI|nr:hypothetical protein HHK36_017082 [Tetracentron sinense]
MKLAMENQFLALFLMTNVIIFCFSSAKEQQYISSVEDPGMRRDGLRVAFEGWNFCKKLAKKILLWGVLELLIVLISQYEPELFPAMIYRMKQPKIVLLIFVSGKIVLTDERVRQMLRMDSSQMLKSGSPSGLASHLSPLLILGAHGVLGAVSDERVRQMLRMDSSQMLKSGSPSGR